MERKLKKERTKKETREGLRRDTGQIEEEESIAELISVVCIKAATDPLVS